ncbi:capsule biosynthesis GfcC family protein [Vibrio comitans]|uniref:Capsule biosynthesis GfcC-like C-terminal domain-containing protein n=1 Tax=Vibrio comitans NBRC 102076 TaxID=1219078 RepID=A0A4Y3IKS0_9VIBR|nr:capsule biosynthesis GfcC family protein [Vibrio comitans]GEA60103.1 hypothetical protein VCO01S_12960 [Vibrio comitans NBRC 102076]
MDLLPSARKSTVQPDGVLESVSYSWWNGEEVYLALGATIFISLAFSIALASTAKLINAITMSLTKERQGLLVLTIHLDGLG